MTAMGLLIQIPAPGNADGNPMVILPNLHVLALDVGSLGRPRVILILPTLPVLVETVMYF